jgi:hypothetical protein
MLTLVRRVGALDAPAAGVGLTRAIRTLGVVTHRPSALGRGFCCCRCGSEIGHGLLPRRWGSLVLVRTKDCCISRGQRMVVKLFFQSVLDVFQARDLHFDKSLSDQERPLLKIPFVSFEDLLDTQHVVFKRFLLLVRKCSQAN